MGGGPGSGRAAGQAGRVEMRPNLGRWGLRVSGPLYGCHALISRRGGDQQGLEQGADRYQAQSTGGIGRVSEAPGQCGVGLA